MHRFLAGVVAAAPGSGAIVSDPSHEGQTLLRQLQILVLEFFNELQTNSLKLIIGIVVALALYGLLLLVRRTIRRRFMHHSVFGTWRWVILRALSKTTVFFLAMLTGKLVMSLFGSPAGWQWLITLLFTLAAAIQGALWTREFLIAMLERRAGRDANDTSISSAVGVITVLINVAVWALTLIILLDNLGVNVTALVAGLGIGGIAIGLAAQGVFSDLFAALSILLDQPFRRGDTIKVGGENGVTGTVERIGLKTTRLRAQSGEVVVLSNTNLLNQQVNNLASYTHRRIVLPIRVLYQTSPDLLEQIPRELREIVSGMVDCTLVSVNLTQFAVSNLDYELICLVENSESDAMLETRQALMLAIIRRFAELGVDFALPAQISFVTDPGGKIVSPVG